MHIKSFTICFIFYTSCLLSCLFICIGSHKIIKIWFLICEQLTIYPGLLSKCRNCFSDIATCIHCGEVYCESLWCFNLAFAQLSACLLAAGNNQMQSLMQQQCMYNTYNLTLTWINTHYTPAGRGAYREINRKYFIYAFRICRILILVELSSVVGMEMFIAYIYC